MPNVAFHEPVAPSPALLNPPFNRRSLPRFNLTLPVVLYRPLDGTKIELQTENVSSNSIFCHCNEAFSPNEYLECEIDIPGDEATSVPEGGFYLACKVQVARIVAQGSGNRFGVAFRFLDYSVVGRDPR